MNKLDLYIKKANLVFTNTTTKLELLDNMKDLNEIEVNYDNSLSLYDIINIYCKLHKAFIKEYSMLDKIEFGNNVIISGIKKYHDYRELSINDDELINEKKTIYITENKDEIKSYISNNKNSLDKDYYSEEIVLDKEKAKKYLDLFEKYSLAFNLFNILHSNMLFSDGTYMLSSKILSLHDSILDKEYDIDLAITAYNGIDSKDSIDITIDLSNEISIKKDECKTYLNNHTILNNEVDYLNVLKSIYLNVSYLNNYWDRLGHKETIDAKSLTKHL